MVSSICVSNELKEPQPAPEKHGSVSIIMAILDTAFSLFVASPLLIAHWAYVWELADATGKTMDSALICALAGFSFLIIACISQLWLRTHAVSKRGNAIPLVAKLYVVLTSLASISCWRGVWLAMDIRFGTDILSCWYTFSIGMAILVLTGTVKTSGQAPPFYVMNDDLLRLNGEIYDFPTRFNPRRMYLKLLDSFFSAIVPTVGVVGVWRALWIPQELFIVFDKDASGFKSNAVSCIVGWASCIILVIMQVPVDNLCAKLESRFSWWARFAVESLWSVLQTLSTVFLWRGIWNYSLIYLPDLFPDTPAVQAKYAMSCITLLFLLGFSICSNSGAKGCVRDGFGIGNFINYTSNASEKMLGQLVVNPGLQSV